MVDSLECNGLDEASSSRPFWIGRSGDGDAGQRLRGLAGLIRGSRGLTRSQQSHGVLHDFLDRKRLALQRENLALARLKGREAFHLIFVFFVSLVSLAAPALFGSVVLGF